MEKEVRIYSLELKRVDGISYDIFNSDNENEVNTKHIDIVKQWADSVDTNKPFVLTSPKRIAFPPNIIYEIEVMNYSLDEWNLKQNPYEKEAQAKGFSGAMGEYFKNK